MVAELHSLEQAARLSMGGFQEPEAEPLAMPQRPSSTVRYTIAAIGALALAIVMLQLF